MTADSQALRDLSKQIDAALIDLITGDDDELPALRRAYLNLVGEFHTETKKQKGNKTMFYYLDKVTGTFGDEADLMIFFIDSTPATADELAEMGDTERLKFVLQNVPRKSRFITDP